jgi:hypothetical protein
MMVVDYYIDQAILVSGVGQQAAEDNHQARRLSMSMFNTFRSVVAITATSVLLSACQTFGLGDTSLVNSTVTAELTPASVTAIAGDMVEQLKGHIGAGANTIRLRGDGRPSAAPSRSPYAALAMPWWRTRPLAVEPRSS